MPGLAFGRNVDRLMRKWRNRPKALWSNFVALATLQGFTYLLPLLLLPYLVRVLGAEKYGLVVFSQAFVLYFQLLVDYGFNLSATREVSLYREDQVKLSEIFSAVLTIKGGFLVVSLLPFLTLVFMVDKFYAYWPLYLLSFLTVIGMAMTPIWLFQGLEEMKYITYANVFARLLAVILILIEVKGPADYLFVPFCNGLGLLLAGLFSLVLAHYRYRLRLQILTPERLGHYLRGGWHIFLAQVNTSLLTNSNVFILGLFAPEPVVAYFAAGEKLIRATVNLSIPVTNTIYPHAAKLLLECRDVGFAFLRKVSRRGGVFFIMIFVVIILFAGRMVRFILGEGYSASVPVVMLLAPIPLTIFLNNIFGTQILVNLGHQKTFFNIITTGGVINIALALALVSPLGHVGVALAVLVAETMICLAMYHHARKLGFTP